MPKSSRLKVHLFGVELLGVVKPVFKYRDLVE